MRILSQPLRSRARLGHEAVAPDRPKKDSSRFALHFARGAFSFLLTASIALLSPLAFGRDTLVGHSSGQGSSSSGVAATSQTATAATQATAQAAQIAVLQRRAKDAMVQSVATMQAMQASQAAARASALAGPNHLAGTTDVPDGIAVGGLNPLGGATVSSSGANGVTYNVPTSWTNVGGLTQGSSNGSTVVTVSQTAPQALLNWTTFNIGKATILNFNQSSSSWVAINQIHDPSLTPSQILGQIRAPGQVYVLNQNGIIFGGSSQVNVHALVASSLPINTNLTNPEFLLGGASTDNQFLFSQLQIDPVTTSSNPLAAFTPTAAPNGKDGDVTVMEGAQLVSPTTGEHVGGKIALIAPVVNNHGTISTPDGQTILAAGLQVGFGAHASSDATLRGVDVYVGGVVDSNGTAQNDNGVAFGTVTNDGLIESPRASITMAGMNVNQNGVIDSETSVALNGRIDLLANFNDQLTVSSSNGVNQTIFTQIKTGNVTFGPSSLTQILPDSSADTVVATALALPSLVTVEGQNIHMASGAVLRAPGAQAVASNVTTSAVGSVDMTGASLTSGVNFYAGTWSLSGIPALSPTSGLVNIDSGANIDVSGVQNVSASVQENIIEAQLRGTELANSPLQQDGALRGATIFINIQNSGVYNGQAWIGSPIGDLSGYAGLAAHTAEELSVNGGTLGIQAGDGVNLASGATLNASGGYINYAGGNVKTTTLVTSLGRRIDISQATSDQIYQGIYAGFTVDSSKWGQKETFKDPFLRNTVYDPGYVQGGNGGAVTISTPTLSLQGNVYANTVAGANQVTPTQLISYTIQGVAAQKTGLAQFAGVNFQGADFSSIILPISAVPSSGTLVLNLFPQSSAAPQDIVFQNGTGPLAPDPFASSGNPVLNLSVDLLNLDGFGHLAIEGNLPSDTNYNATQQSQAATIQGNIAVPAGVILTTLPGGSITLASVNLDIEGSILAPGGSLSFTTQNATASAAANATVPLAPTAGRGNFTLGNGAVLSVAGLVVNNTGGTSASNLLPQVLSGGSITIKSFNADLQLGTSIDASGGVVINSKGKATYGAGGSIDIEAGRDGFVPAGGTLNLSSNLSAYSGKTGGSLSITAPAIQVGGATLQNGDTSGNPTQENSYLWGNGTTLWIDRTGSPDFLSAGGFTKFSLTGLGLAPITYANGFVTSVDPYASTPGVYIAPDTTLHPIADSYNVIDDASGAHLMVTTFPLASLRSPVSLTFNASGSKSDLLSAPGLVARGDLVMGAGSVIQTDPLGSVTLKGQTVTILGKVYAPGGSITVSGASDSTLLFASNSGDPASNDVATVDLAPGSVLSTAGVAEDTVNSLGFHTGNVLNGGKITISGNIVGEAGSVLDVSGVSATYDVLPAYINQTLSGFNSRQMLPTLEASNAGSIVLNGGQELFVDSTLLGRAGSPDAQGGSLTVSNGFSGYNLTSQATPVQNPLDATLTVIAGGPTRATTTLTGQAVIGQEVMPTSAKADVDGNAILGYFAANSNLFVANPESGNLVNNGGMAGGFASLTLNNTVQFAGPVSISTSSSLIVANNPASSSSFTALSGGVIYTDSSVTLNSAYVRLGLPFMGPGGTGLSPLMTSGPGSLTVNASKLIDVGNVSMENINQLNLNSGGDIRGDGSLNVAGNISITAAQIYPTTESTFTIAAFNPQGGTSTVTFAKVGGQSSLPLSAGGVLNVYADTIIQGGVLRAPLGTINLGSTSLAPASSTGAPTTSQVTLSAGSITSVSAIDPVTGLGVTIPYGTIDASGKWIDPAGNTLTAGSTPTLPAKLINISGANIDEADGSTVDIRGGGDLSASQFNSGTGGTSDIYSSTTSFAILPSSSQFVSAPYDVVPGYTTSSYSNLQVGDQIHLSASSGLPAGDYTLLPARYALLPGAYLVTPKSGTPQVTAVTEHDGSSLVSGYRLSSLNSIREQPLAALFEVSSQAVLQGRAEYITSSANTYFAKNAIAQDLITPRLPMDAGQLVLKATQALTLARDTGTLQAQAAVGGLGGIVDIATPIAINIYNSQNPLTSVVPGALNLDSGGLTALNAGSLLIGGFRDSSGTSATVTTSSITVNNEGAPLSANDLILVSNGALQVDAGSVITASAGSYSVRPLAIGNGGSTVAVASSSKTSNTVTLSSSVLPAGFGVGSGLLGSTVKSITNNTVTLAGVANANIAGNTAETFLNGDGTLLRVNGAASSVTTRPYSINLADPAPNMVIGGNVTIRGASVALDSTGLAGSIDSSAILSASSSISISSGQISLVLGDTGPTTGLVISGQALDTLQNSAQALSLLSYSSLDIWGAGNIGASAGASGQYSVQNLALHAAEIRGFDNAGQTVNINAENVVLDNFGRGTTAGAVQATASGATLAINAGTVTLGDNGMAIDQYAQVTLSASKGILLGNGTGSLTSAGNLTLSTPLITSSPLVALTPLEKQSGQASSTAANQTIAALGSLTIINPGGTVQNLNEGLGASLTLSGAGVQVGSNIQLPSGSLTIVAVNGDLTVDGNLDVSGTEKNIYSLTERTSGGQINLTSYTGGVALNAGSRLNLSAQPGGGNAGSLSISAPNGIFAFAGSTILGQGGTGGQGGSFSLDAASLVTNDLAPLQAVLNPIIAGSSGTTLGGFTKAQTIRLRTGDIMVDGITATDAFDLSTDNGSITVSGKIIGNSGQIDSNGNSTANIDITMNANSNGAAVLANPGVNGGTIDLVAGGSNGSVVLLNGSLLSVAGQTINDAGKGGAVSLEAGSEINGVEPSTSQTRDATTHGFTGVPVVDIQAGSVIDLSVATTSKIFDGSVVNGQAGTLHLRAPQTTSHTDVQINPINGTVINPSSIVVEGYQVFNAGGTGSIDGQEAAVLSNGKTFAGVAGQPATSTYTAMLNALISLFGINSSLQAVTLIEPGAEIVNPNIDTLSDPTAGDLTLHNTWNLTAYRFGPNSVAGNLTLRAGGNLVFNFGASLSDGFVTNPYYTAGGLWASVLMPAGSQTWSYRLVSGSDFQAADYHQVLPENQLNALVQAAPNALITNGGSVLVGLNAPALPVSSGATTAQIMLGNAGLGIPAYYQTIRTGNGDITVASGEDVQLLNSVATIYTAGTQVSQTQLTGAVSVQSSSTTSTSVLLTSATFPSGFGIGSTLLGSTVLKIAGRTITLAARANATVTTPTSETFAYSVPMIGFDVPTLTDSSVSTQLGTNSAYNFPLNTATQAQYGQLGGNLVITAQGDIAHYVIDDFSTSAPIVGYDINGNPLVDDSSKELPTNWLYRRGYATGGVFGTDSNGQVASTTWWIDYSNFFEGVGALGGGNVTLTAGRNITNVDAVVPTNAMMPGKDAAGNLIAPSASNLVERGGGDLVVHAGNNISGGVYYVERGNGTIGAAGQITTNATRTVVPGNALDLSETYLPTTFFLGKGNLDISAGGDLLLGPVANAFLLPQGINNTVKDKSYFSTYASTDSVNASSLTGNVTVEDSSFPTSLLTQFYENQVSAGGTGVFAASFPWLGLVETDPSTFDTQASLMPPNLRLTSFSGDINLINNLTLFPSTNGDLEIVAFGSVNAFQPVGVDINTGIVSWGSSQVNLSDANPANIPGTTTPLSYVADPAQKITLADTNSGVFSTLFDSLFGVSGSTTGKYSQLITQQALHADLPIDASDPNSALGPLHANDSVPVYIYAGIGNIDGVNLFSGKMADVVAGNDIENISLYVQNVNSTDITLVQAGRDIVAYDKDSFLRQETHAVGGIYLQENHDSAPNATDNFPDGLLSGAPNAGDIQIAGPGTLEVLAGRNLTLGDGAAAGDGTGLGIVTIGNTVDPSLSTFGGANVIAAAGLAPTSAFAFDLSQNQTLNFSSFIEQFLNPVTGGSQAERYLPDLGSRMGLTNATNDQIWAAFNSLSVQHQDILALTTFYDVLRDAGRDHNDPSSPTAGTYTNGYNAVEALFPASNAYQGDISLTAREIKTTNGGDINLLAPGGGVDVGLNNSGTQAIDQGILTVSGGNISIFTRNNVAVGTSRIFTLHGGNEILWSSFGNIAAGASSKTVQSAPPTRVLIDPQSGNVQTDLAGLATGGGIGVLETIAGAAPGDVDLIAPRGIVDAGDAGIRSSGNINIAATQILNASNIQSGGSTSGVAAPVSANIGATVAASAAAGSSNNAATEAAKQQQPHPQSQEEEAPSIISVVVIGYGGDDQ